MVVPTESEDDQGIQSFGEEPRKAWNHFLSKFLYSDLQEVNLILTPGQECVQPQIEGFECPDTSVLREMAELLWTLSQQMRNSTTGLMELRGSRIWIDLEVSWVTTEGRKCLSVVKHPEKPGSDPTETYVPFSSGSG